MSTDVEFVPIAAVDRRRRSAVAVAVAVLLVSACSSKNPDSLIGMNLDENAAMMDANDMSDVNAAENESAATSPNGSGQSTGQLTGNANAAAGPDAQQRSIEVNSVPPESPPEGDTGADQNDNEGTAPDGASE
jgi:hypothetical protein